MLDRWLLPGPANLVSSIVGDLVDGHQVVLRALDESTGLRRALETALADRYHKLRVVYDRPDEAPRSILLRDGFDGVGTATSLAAGIYWIDPLPEERVSAWSELLSRVVDEFRNRDLGDRLQLVMQVPADSPMPHGLGLSTRVTRPLSRLDLEVAARYAIAGGPDQSAVSHLRSTLAVELATPLLPAFAALDALDLWMGVPDAALSDPLKLERYGSEARLPVPSLGGLKLALWRSQHAILMSEIEMKRFEIISGATHWRVPYRHVQSDGRVEKEVQHLELLELSHLCSQAKSAGLPYNDPVRRHLEALRAARNALSHLDPLDDFELRNLLDR